MGRAAAGAPPNLSRALAVCGPEQREVERRAQGQPVWKKEQGKTNSAVTKQPPLGGWGKGESFGPLSSGGERP